MDDEKGDSARCVHALALGHRARRLRHAGPAAVAALQHFDSRLIISGLRIGSGTDVDEVGLESDDENQCLSALPFFDPYRTLPTPCLASVFVFLPATPIHPPTHLASSAACLPTGVKMWCFPATADDIRCAGTNRYGCLTRSSHQLTHLAHAPGFVTKVSNHRIMSMLAQHHRHTTHTGCWDELGAYCGAWSSSQQLRSR